MIGMFSGYADEFLIWLSALTAVLFAIPLLIDPMRWASILGWRIPAHTDLAVYLGRSLSVVAIAINAACIRAGLTGVAIAELVSIVIVISVLMVFIHAWGAFRKIQPLSETIEIGFWFAIALGALAVYPG